MPSVPSVKLNNGLSMPAIGLGTWQARAAAPGEVVEAVKTAIDLGYRHFDCAMVYQNEADVGEGIRQKIKDGTVKREDVFVVSKLWNTYHDQAAVVPECKKTLQRFGLDYIDLYLIHWPFAVKNTGELFPGSAEGVTPDGNVDYVETWRGMEECVEQGLAKSIGVSNFNSHQLTRILESAKIKPVTNQIECHPYLNQKKLIAWCKEKGIVITAYSPLGSPTRPWAKPGDPTLLEDPRLLAIAKRVSKTPGQVVLNFLVKLGVVPIPKSTNRQRLLDNINVFDFLLTEEDMATLSSIDCKGRICGFLDAREHKDYPFNAEF